MSLRLTRPVYSVAVSLGMETVAFLYCLALFEGFGRISLYAVFYTLPMDGIVEPLLRHLHLIQGWWRAGQIIGFCCLSILNAAKWLIIVHLCMSGRGKLAGVLAAVFIVLLLVSFSVRDLPL